MSANINEIFLEAVGRHFVTLSCMYTPPDATKERPLLFSGFVVAIDDIWFHVTAGHVPQRVVSSMVAGGTFDVWRLGDQSARGPFKETGIPFDFVPEGWIVLDDEASGLDYAALPLRNIYREALERGGVVPITKTAWSDHVAEFDQWVLVGVPAESVSHNGESILMARLVSVALEKTGAPEGAGAKAENQFYARPIDGSERVVRNVEGMSGGPIFSTERVDGKIRYNLIGVQSAWYKADRIVAACPFSSLGISLESAVNDAKAELTEQGPVDTAPDRRPNE